MTFSQKIALAFTIAGFILLIPGTFGLLVVAIFLFQPSVPTISFFLVILMIWAAGCALLRGYLMHTLYKYTPASSIWLWLCTIIYNGIPAAVMSYWSIAEYNRVTEVMRHSIYPPDYKFLISWLLPITFGYILAVVLAGLALRSEIKPVD